ncbi:MAG: YncE family protein [Pseudomonadales bacterium]|nr:YncE family protein [Pseudomonadales bacterium]NIX07513.1 YncE family protein [Pseudomonadales bacterium]
MSSRFRHLIRVLIAALWTAAVGAAEPTGTLLVVNKGGDSVTMLDLSDGRELAELPTGRGPHELVVSADGRLAVVTDYAGGNSLTVIDVAARRVVRTVDLADYPRPHGIAFMPDGDRVVVTSEATDKIVFVRTSDGAVTGSIDTGAGGSHMLAITADGSRVFTTNMRSDSVSEIDVAAGERIRVYPTPGQPEAIAVTPDGAEIWVGSNAEGSLSVIRTDDATIETVADGFGWPYRILISADGNTVLVPDLKHSVLRAFERATGKELPGLKLPGAGPQGLVLHPDERLLFLSLNRQNRVAVIDLKRWTITRYLNTGSRPDGIGYTTVGPGS